MEEKDDDFISYRDKPWYKNKRCIDTLNINGTKYNLYRGAKILLIDDRVPITELKVSNDIDIDKDLDLEIIKHIIIRDDKYLKKKFENYVFRIFFIKVYNDNQKRYYFLEAEVPELAAFADDVPADVVPADDVPADDVPADVVPAELKENVTTQDHDTAAVTSAFYKKKSIKKKSIKKKSMKKKSIKNKSMKKKSMKKKSIKKKKF